MDDLSIEEQRRAGVELMRNPFTRAVCEAMVIYQTELKLDGFTSSLAREGIRKRFGDDGVRRWDEIAGTVEALRDETTDAEQLGEL